MGDTIQAIECAESLLEMNEKISSVETLLMRKDCSEFLNEMPNRR